MSQLNAEFVKRGFWVDNTRGPVLGQTITTDTTTGNLVVALVAVITTLGISHLWNLVVFGYHQMRVNSHPTDGLFRQQQALMRTLPAPGAILSDWSKLWWVWRKRVNKPLLRTLPLMILAILFTAVTIVVGVFSSYLVDSTNISILVQGPRCGPVDFDGVDPPNNSSAQDEYSAWINGYISNVGNLASSYAKDCYANRTATPERCRIFTQPTLPYQQERTDCPWESSMCKKNVTQPGLVIDTGLLDLNDHFGLNLAAKDRMKFRRRTTCAVIDLEDHQDTRNATLSPDFERLSGRKPYAEEQNMRIYLGGGGPANYTQGIAFMPNGGYNHLTTAPAFDYALPYWQEMGATFEPIPQLRSKESDLVVITITTNGLRFNDPVDDPLFPAHVPYYKVQSDKKRKTSYMSDAPGAAFGCQYQYQFCFSQPGKSDSCTNLAGLPTTQSEADFPGANDIQLALLRLLVIISYYNCAETAGDHLLVLGTTSGGSNQKLPDDHWIREFVAMENNIQAQTQIALSSYATGFTTLDLKPSVPMRRNQTEAEKGLCTLQRMRSPGGFVNINVFALAFVISFCVVATTLDIVLLKFLVFWQKFRGLLAPRIDSWIQDGTFQLQRRAYEAQGEGNWERLNKEVPATRDDAELATLSMETTELCRCREKCVIEENPLSAATTLGSQGDWESKK